MYKVTVVVRKVSDNRAMSKSKFEESVEKAKALISDTALEISKLFDATGEVEVGVIVEENGRCFDSDSAFAIISNDKKSITYEY